MSDDIDGERVQYPRGSFERGYYIGEQRALSRLALGLPLDRVSKDADLVPAVRAARGETLDDRAVALPLAA